MQLSKKQITKALIRLRGWPAGLRLCCSQPPEDRVSCDEAQYSFLKTMKSQINQFLMSKPADLLSLEGTISLLSMVCLSVDRNLTLSYFLASDDFCCLLITFANSLDPDQAQQNISPDLDSNCLTH